MQKQQKVSVPMYQWKTANSLVTLLQAEIANMAAWCKEPDTKEQPSIVKAISYWTQIFDFSERLTATPVNIPPEQEEAMRKNKIYTLAYIKAFVPQVNGMLKKLEEKNPVLFQNTLREQIREASNSFKNSFDNVRKLDEEEFEELYSQVDTLEWLRMGINIIRLEYPRLKDINYHSYEQKLRRLKGQFYDAVDGKSMPIPYAPQSFKWRKEQ
mgnify:CR=1 FL=1